MDKMWAGRFTKALDKEADDFNSSLHFFLFVFSFSSFLFLLFFRFFFNFNYIQYNESYIEYYYYCLLLYTLVYICKRIVYCVIFIGIQKYTIKLYDITDFKSILNY